jgi:ADP-heptose:LPS heptosyltransferase
LSFQNLLPLFSAEGVQVYILQADAAAAGWQEGYGIHPGEFSLADYARMVKGLDLLITVDSMPAHLAGAMGVPVWTLLHAGADWRWMDEREDSPWYPTMRLFRQKEQGDWDRVIQEVKNSLAKLVQQKSTNTKAALLNKRRA